MLEISEVLYADPQDYLGNLVYARRMANHCAAIELENLAGYTRMNGEEMFAYLEISTSLNISDRAAQRRMEFAVTLTERLPRTLATFKQGRIEEFKAQLICEAVEVLTDEQALAIEALVCWRRRPSKLPPSSKLELTTGGRSIWTSPLGHTRTVTPNPWFNLCQRHRIPHSTRPRSNRSEPIAYAAEESSGARLWTGRAPRPCTRRPVHNRAAERRAQPHQPDHPERSDAAGYGTQAILSRWAGTLHR